MILEEMKYAYFLGIGGIGMSAIARYFNQNHMYVSGYDKTPSTLTDELHAEGIQITFQDEVQTIPKIILDHLDSTLFVYTPAIPADSVQLNYLKSIGVTPKKRSEVLGIISRDSYCIAIGGTHGKTTTSTLIAHLLHSANVNFTAFLGGISANYGTNYIRKTDGRELFYDRPVVVLEADEFDRSFHTLQPDITIITAMDADHLDVYKTEAAFYEAFQIFTDKTKSKGNVILNTKVDLTVKEDVNLITYVANGNTNANCKGIFTSVSNGNFNFNYTGIIQKNGITEQTDLVHLFCGIPGFHNIENATAAIAACSQVLQIPQESIREGLASFRGAKRRFEYVIKSDQYVVIDDYAHHPQELNAILNSVKALYADKKLTALFQPHLFSRTRDFGVGFGESLSIPDEIILMEIYPARELPISGINSHWLLEKITNPRKSVLSESEILHKIQREKPELLLILGAGDIDRMVPKIKEAYENF